MLVETSLREFPLPRVAEMARLAEGLSFDQRWVVPRGSL